MTQPTVNKIRVANPPLEGEPRTYLTADVASAATVLATVSNDGFTLTGESDYYIIIGDYEFEKSEISLVDANGGSTSNTGFTVGATKYTHEASDPVTFMRYYELRIYGATSSGGTKVLIDTINIDPTQQFTEYTYEGATYSYFYSAYYNSNDDEISAYSEEISTTAFGRKSVQRIIDSALIKALTEIDESSNGRLNWDNCITILGDGVDEILARKRKWSFLRKRSTGDDTVASTQYIEKPSDIAELEFIIIDDKELQFMNRARYNSYTASGATATTGSPLYYTTKNDKYYLIPTPDSTYEVIYEYYKLPADITDLNTNVDVQFVPILIYYCASHFSYIRGNDKRGDKMYAMFEKLLEQQVVEYSGPEQSGQAESIDKTSVYDIW